MSSNPITPTAHPTHQDCLITVGPAPNRDETCTICINDILPTDASVTHSTCLNTTHDECFASLIAHANQSLSGIVKCPSCQEICPSHIASRPTGQTRYVRATQGILDAALAEGPPGDAPRPLRYLSERRLDDYFYELMERMPQLSAVLQHYRDREEHENFAAGVASVERGTDILVSLVTEAIHREREGGELRMAEWLDQVAVLLENFDEGLVDGDDDDEIFHSTDEMLDTSDEEVDSDED